MKHLFKSWPGLVLCVTAVIGLTAAIAWAAEENEKQEVKVTLDQVPAAVKATIEQESQGARIEEIEKETKDGKTTYEVEIARDGKELEIEFAEDGTVLSREEDDDDDGDDEDDDGNVKLTLEQLPAAVQATIQRESRGAQIKSIEKEVENGRTAYEAELKAGKEKSEIKVAEDGKLLERETEVALKDVPPAVRATLEKEARGGKIKEVEKVEKDGRVVYEAEIELEVEVAEDGSLIERAADDRDDEA